MPTRGRKQPIGDESESDQYDDEISTFHKEREKILIDSDRGQSSESEEVDLFPIDDDDDSDDDDEEIAGYKQQLRQLRRNKFKKKMDSDLEEDDEEEAAEAPEAKAWGSKRSWYMGGDVRDNKIILSGSEDEATAGAAALEEKEAMEIQKRHTALMSEEDFMIPASTKGKSKPEKKKKKKKSSEDDDEENEIQGLVRSGKDELEKIETDFSKLSKKEEQEIMKKMHPEYIPLLNDFNSKCQELQERILPLMRLVKENKIQGLGAEYARMKYHIITNYLSNGAFYMYLVAKRAKGIHEHPVIKRLVQFQNLYKRLLPVDERVKEDVNDLLERVKRGEDVHVITSEEGADAAKKKRKLAKKMKEGMKEKKRRMVAVEEGESEEEEEEEEDEQRAVRDGEEEDMDEEERRAITYQMEKNKGLTAHKKKEARNPRVKHRVKFRRAKIRRKGQVRDFKPPKQLYTGEVTGIRAGIIRSRKLK